MNQLNFYLANMKTRILALTLFLIVAMANTPTDPVYYSYLRGTLKNNLENVPNIEVILCSSDSSGLKAQEILESVPDGAYWNNQVVDTTDEKGKFILSLLKFRDSPFFPSVCVIQNDSLVKIFETADSSIVMRDTTLLLEPGSSGGCSNQSTDTEYYGYESYHTAIEIKLKQVCPECLPPDSSISAGKIDRS